LYTDGNRVRHLTPYSAGDQVGLAIFEKLLFFTLNGNLIYRMSYKWQDPELKPVVWMRGPLTCIKVS
jgi:hypothetical protein